MKNFYRRAVRLSALSALCLALPAAAQVGMGRIAEIETSPFGTFPGAWSGALNGALLKPAGSLNVYAFPPSDNGKPSYDEATAAAPDLAVLHRLAPVLVALKQSGVTPDEFMKLSPDDQARKVRDILPESGKLVASYAGRIVMSLDRVDSEAEDQPVDVELADLIKNYSAYADHMDQAGQDAFSAANLARFSERGRRIAARARDEAGSLNHALPQDTDVQPAAEAIAEPVRMDARLAEIKILSAQMTKGASARTEAAHRAFSLATTGAPNEAVQRAAIRILTTAVEKGGKDPRYKEWRNIIDVKAWIKDIGVIAMQTPYAGVQRLVLNNLTDNVIGETYRGSALATVETIAVAAPSREIKEEAISLLLREIESSSSLIDKEIITARIDTIKAGMASEPQIAKAPEKQAARASRGNKIAAGGIAASLISILYGVLLAHGGDSGAVAGLLIAAGGILMVIFASYGESITRALPWYRKDD